MVFDPTFESQISDRPRNCLSVSFVPNGETETSSVSLGKGSDIERGASIFVEVVSGNEVVEAPVFLLFNKLKARRFL